MVEFGLIVRVFENNIVSSDAVNGSLVTAEAAGLSVMRVLHEWGIYGLTTPYSDKKALTPNYDYEGLIVYDVNFTGELPLAALVSVNVPGLVSPAQTVTLTDTTGGASGLLHDGWVFPRERQCGGDTLCGAVCGCAWNGGAMGGLQNGDAGERRGAGGD
jgi:hypothetical protein